MVVRTFRNFGKMQDAVEIPDLVAVQRESYAKFLQKDVAPTKRADTGLEALFREIFPIESYDKKMTLEYICYELEKPHYTPLECRQLRLTYAYPSEDSLPAAVGERCGPGGAGDLPGRNARHDRRRRVHRQRRRARASSASCTAVPGVDFLIESKEGDRVLHGGRIIPERGSWIEIGVTKKDILVVQIDQSSKIPATMFLRAMDPEYGTTEADPQLFYQTKTVPDEQADVRPCGRSARSWTPRPARSSSRRRARSARRSP